MKVFWSRFYSKNKMDSEIKKHFEKEGKTMWIRGRIIWLYHRARNKFSCQGHLLTPCRRVFLAKLTGFQVVKKFPAFNGTQRFITAFTSAHHLSLPWARSIQSITPHPTSWRSIKILSSHLCLGLPSGLFPSGFPTKTLYKTLLSPMCHTPCPSHSSRFYHP